MSLKSARVEKLLRPKSIAVVGVSEVPGSVGLGVLQNLEHFQFQGQVHLVSRSQRTLAGRPCYTEIDELPEGIDVVILCLPVSAAIDAVLACERRRAGAVVLFGAGYAESGPEGKRTQQQIEDIAMRSGMLVIGPNCMGLTNFVDGVPLTFAPGLKRTLIGDKPGVGILTQSGGMMSNLREICQARGVSISYALSTGNEAVVGIEDFLTVLVDDPATKVIALYVEQIRHPQWFLELAKRARDNGKAMVLLHPGKSDAAREAARTHTGSLVGDIHVIRCVLEAEGVLTVDTIEELVDAAWLLNWVPVPTTGGTAMLTDSGAMKGFALDYCDTVGLKMPGLSAATESALSEILPAYTAPTNPLDITAQALREPHLYGDCAECLIDDEAMGSLMAVVLPGSRQIGLRKAQAFFPIFDEMTKPIVFVVLGEGAPISDELVEELTRRRIPLFRSIERAMRALASLNRYSELQARAQNQTRTLPQDSSWVRRDFTKVSGRVTLPEYEGKAYLHEAGIATPAGGLCQDLRDATKLAESLGYPVAIKAQASELAHKSDVGGVILGIQNAQQLASAWETLHANVARQRPGVKLDGVLVEQMSREGIEVVVGARRDEHWGPVVMVGLGGVWVEVLRDVRMIPPQLPRPFIVDEILRLQSSPLLQGARGQSAVDVDAMADVVARVGMMMHATPELEEIEINPLIVYESGHGAMAVDALVVVAGEPVRP
ncbi:acetate--CoA ligase family protein [Alicyclobacillus curvatus]|nr:acetate--CoA ligase family protein [Alicyclobacillus curvatus]